jgi:shikimate kinase
MTRIILIGFMGSGKTTLGRALAKDLGIEFIDLDNYIELRRCKSINNIFAEMGEEGFRTIERNLLHEVCEFENVIISAGGGTPCFFDNIDYMNQQGETFFLKAEPDVIQAHLMMGKTQRPLIQGKSPEELNAFIKKSLKEREPFYAKAKHTINIELIERNSQILHYVNVIKKCCGIE